MVDLKSKGAFLFCAVLVLVCLNPVSGEILNRVVAIVNDEVITLHELNQMIKEMTGSSAKDLRLQNEDRFLKLRERILEFLINEKIAEEKIRELGIKVTQTEIDAAIEKLKQDNKWTHEDLVSKLNADGITYEKYRNKMKQDLERLRLINYEVKSKIIIRDEQITAYYQEHVEEFRTEGKVHLAGIFLTLEDPQNEAKTAEIRSKGEGILTKLKNGEDFSELAREFSQGPGADQGGDLGVFKTAELDPELGQLVEAMPEGGFSGLIFRPYGIQIIKLIEKEVGKTKTPEEVREAIYGRLYSEEVEKRYLSWITELRKSSYTTVIF
jgi:peptidyl-prolyl cis-trans isomerase SurA